MGGGGEPTESAAIGVDGEKEQADGKTRAILLSAFRRVRISSRAPEHPSSIVVAVAVVVVVVIL